MSRILFDAFDHKTIVIEADGGEVQCQGFPIEITIVRSPASGGVGGWPWQWQQPWARPSRVEADWAKELDIPEFAPEVVQQVSREATFGVGRVAVRARVTQLCQLEAFITTALVGLFPEYAAALMVRAALPRFVPPQWVPDHQQLRHVSEIREVAFDPAPPEVVYFEADEEALLLALCDEDP